MRRRLDPRRVNVLFDANGLDSNIADQADIDRIMALGRSGKINLIAPDSVRGEILDPRTPRRVQDLVLPQIFTIVAERTAGEVELFHRVLAILQGNAKSGKHDADARHVAEAAKYGGYFITHDTRINQKKRAELEAVLPPSLCIVTLQEFLEIFDRYEAGQIL